MAVKTTEIKLRVTGVDSLEKLILNSEKYAQVQKRIQTELDKAARANKDYLSTVQLSVGVGEKLTVVTKKTADGLAEQTAVLKSNTAEKERAVATTKMLAAQEVALKTSQSVGARLTRVTSTAGGTTDEITKLKDSIAAVREYVKANEISYAKVEQLRKRVAAGDIRQYAKQTAALQKHLRAVKTANEQIGASSRKLAAARARIHMQALAEYRQRAIAEAAQIAQRRETARSLIALQALTKTLRVSKKATVADIVDYKSQISKLREYVRVNRISARDVDNVWGRVKNGNIRAYGTALDGLQSKMRRLQTATALSTSKSKKHVESLLLSWKSMSRIITAQLIRRAISGFIMATRRAIDETRQLSMAVAELRTISQQAQLTQAKWTEGILELSDAFGFTALDQVEAAYQTLSNQVAEGAETFKFLAEANKFAVTAATDSATAVNLLTAAINAFGLSTNDTEHIAAVLFKTIEQGRVRASEMANSLGDVGILGHQLGITLEELAATISTLTINGVKYTKAATQLRGIMIKLIKPTGEMKKFFKELGVATGEEAIQVYGLNGFLFEMAKRVKGSTTELGKLINRVRGISGALALTGSGFETFKKNLELNQNAIESYRQATIDAFDNVGRSATIMQQRLKNVFTRELGISFLETLVSIDKSVGGLDTVLTSVIRTVFSFESAIALTGAAVTALTTKLIILGKAHPWSALAIAATTVGAAIAATIHKSVELQEQFDRAAIKRRKTTINNAEREANAIGRILKNSVKARVQIQRRAIAQLISEETKYFDQAVQNYNTLEKVVKKTYASIIKAADKALTGLLSDINKSKSAIQSLEDSLVSMFQEQADIEFEVKLDAATATEKLRLIRDEISRTLDTAKGQAKAGDRSGAEASSKRALALQDRIKSIAESSAGAREKLQKDISKLQEAGAKKDIKAAKAVAKIRFDTANKVIDIQNKLHVLRAQQAAREAAIRQGATVDARGSKTLKIIELENKLINTQIDGENKVKAALAKQDDARSELLKKTNALKASTTEQIGVEETVNKYLADRKTIIEQIRVLNLKMIDDQLKRIKVLEREHALLATNRAELVALVSQTAGFDISTASTDEMRRQVKLLERQSVLASTLGLKDTARAQAIADQITEIKDTAIDRKARGDALKQIGKDLITKQDVTLKLIDKATEKNVEAAKSVGGYVAEVRNLLADLSKLTGELNALGVSGPEMSAVTKALEKAKGAAKIDFSENPEALERLRRAVVRANLVIKDFGTTASPSGKVLELFGKTAEGVKGQIEVIQKALSFNLKKVGDTFKESLKLGTLKTEAEALAKKYAENTQLLLRAEGLMSNTNKNSAEIATNMATTATSLERIAKAINTAMSSIKAIPAPTNFATGGQVGRDTISARLSPGEFVMNASASKRFYSQLQSMNNQPVQNYNTGGSVTSYGDFNISVPSGGGSGVDVVAIGKGLQRAIRQGRVKLS